MKIENTKLMEINRVYIQINFLYFFTHVGDPFIHFDDMVDNFTVISHSSQNTDIIATYSEYCHVRPSWCLTPVLP